MKKVLFVSHTANFAKFNYLFMRWFKDAGWRVDYASDGKEEVKDCDHSYQICFERSPFKKENVQAYKQLKKLLDEEHYDLIHCHTPMGSVIARLAAKESRKSGTKVIYTAHGFHFFKGAPIVNWMLYYSVEKLLAKHMDCLVTINGEDYANAVNRKFKVKKIEQIDGVGVNLERFAPASQEEKEQLRMNYGFQNDEYILICVAEINKNKNQKFIIENLPQIKKDVPGVKLLIVGDCESPEGQQCQQLVKELHLERNVEFLGYRRDVDNLLKASDVLVSASQREGLAVNIIEGMASGLPVICADTRGQRDLIETGVNGIVYDVGNHTQFCEAVVKLYKEKETARKFAAKTIELVQKYSSRHAVERMAEIYKEVLNGGE